MTTRRDFLKTGAALAALSALPVGHSCSPAKKEKAIGLQLWSIHEDINENFDAAIKSVVNIGYKHFEGYGYTGGKFYGKTPQELRKYLAGLGAQMTGTHASIPLLEDGDTEGWDFWKKITADAAESGCKWIVQTRWRLENPTLSDVMRVANQFNKCGEIAKSHGIKFAFHSWMDEFVGIDGQVPYIMLLENTDPNLVSFEIDTVMMTWAGYVCHEFVQKFPGRFCSWHIKDVTPNTPDKRGHNTELGKGFIDFEGIFDAFEIAGTQDYYVEQESFSMPRMESLKYDYDFLSNASFVKW